MRLGRVVGTVVATRKNASLEGAALLLVQPVTLDDEPWGAAVLAVDAAQAGVGDTVLLVIEGRAAGSALRRVGAPVDAAIVGVVDSEGGGRRGRDRGTRHPASAGVDHRAAVGGV